MPTLMQSIHLMAAVVGLGGMGFVLLILLPSLGVLSPEQREALSKADIHAFILPCAVLMLGRPILARAVPIYKVAQGPVTGYSPYPQ